MYSISIFGQLLKGLPRSDFDRLVKRRNADKYCKSYKHWNHLVTMVFAQLTKASGLRTLEASFNQHRSHHHHLGMAPIRRTTVAEANEKRSEVVFADVAQYLMSKVSRSLRAEAQELIYLLDSTSITLKGREFERWAPANRNRNTQGLKLHLLLDAKLNAPAWHAFSDPNVNDVTKAHEVVLQQSALYVFDKGYCDYNWWNNIDQAGARFVTRFKANSACVVVSDREIDAAAQGIVLKDEIVSFRYKTQSGRKNLYNRPLRRITVARPDKGTALILATNDLTSPALMIAQRYRERWQIELFFKWIKQHLKLKSFMGRSENAVRIQILTALIAHLLVELHRKAGSATCTLWEWLSIVATSLFTRPEPADSPYRIRRVRQEEYEKKQMALPI